MTFRGSRGELVTVLLILTYSFSTEVIKLSMPISRERFSVLFISNEKIQLFDNLFQAKFWTRIAPGVADSTQQFLIILPFK